MNFGEPVPPPPRREMTRAPLTMNLAIAGKQWREQVKMRLIDGLGVEDIAMRLGCHLSHVQAEVKRLRRVGDLAKWWPSL